MPDRIKLRRGPKSKIDLNVYELGYVTDQNEQRLYFNNGSIVPIPNQQDITNIKTELTKTTNVSNKNKQDILDLKDTIIAKNLEDKIFWVEPKSTNADIVRRLR